VHRDLATLRVVVRALPHVDYALLRERRCHSQLALDLEMPAGYRAPPAPFDPARLRGAAIADAVVPLRSGDAVAPLRVRQWDGRTFCGAFELLDASPDDVRLCVQIAPEVRQRFADLARADDGERRPGRPAPPRDPGLAAAQFAVVRDGPFKGHPVHIREIENDTVVATLLPQRQRRPLAWLRLAELGFYSVEVPAAVLPVHVQYPRHTLVRAADGSVGVVAAHDDGGVVVYTLANRRRRFERREIAERLPDDPVCRDAHGWRVGVGDRVRFQGAGGMRYGTIVRTFDGQLLLRPTAGGDDDALLALPAADTERDHSRPGEPPLEDPFAPRLPPDPFAQMPGARWGAPGQDRRAEIMETQQREMPPAVDSRPPLELAGEPRKSPVRQEARRTIPWWGEKGAIVTVVGEAGRFAIAGVGRDGTAHIQKICGHELEFTSLSPDWQFIERVPPVKAGDSVLVRGGSRNMSGKVLAFRENLTADVDVSDGKRPVVQMVRVDDLALLFDWKLTEDE
jgi:hypothetical protein